jgi:hypothetical protein
MSNKTITELLPQLQDENPHLIELLKQQEKNNIFNKFDTSIQTLIRKLTYKPTYSIVTEPLEQYVDKMIGGLETTTVTIPTDKEYYAGDYLFRETSGTTLEPNMIIREMNNFNPNQLKPHDYYFKYGLWCNGDLTYQLNQELKYGRREIQMNLQSIYYNMVLQTYTGWLKYYDMSRFVPKFSDNIRITKKKPQPLQTQLHHKLPFDYKPINNTEVEMLFYGINMIGALTDNSLDKYNDFIEQLVDNYYGKLNNDYQKANQDMIYALKLHFAQKAFPQKLGKKEHYNMSKLDDKQLSVIATKIKKFSNLIDVEPSEEQIEMSKIRKQLYIHDVVEKINKLVKDLKVSDGYYVCPKGNPVICTHEVDYIRLQAHNFTEDDIKEYITKYGQEIIRGIQYCKYCGEELNRTDEMEQNSLEQSLGIQMEVDDELKKELWKQIRFSLSYLKFNGLYSDRYKNQFAGKINKIIYPTIIKQYRVLNRSKTMSDEEKQANKKILTTIIIFAAISKFIQDNTIITYRARPEHKNKISFDEKSFERIIEPTVSIVMHIVRNELEMMTNFTRNNIRKMILVALERLKMGDSAMKKELKILNIQTLASYTYMAQIYESERNMKPLDKFVKDYPQSMYESKSEPYKTYREFIIKQPKTSMHTTQITKSESFVINPIINQEHRVLVDMMKALKKTEWEKIKKTDPLTYVKMFGNQKHTIKFNKRLGELSLAYRYGSKPHFHKHVWGKAHVNGKLIDTSLIKMDQIGHDFVCVVCGKTTDKAITTEKEIYENYLTNLDKDLFYKFITDVCPKTSGDHNFQSGKCTLCGWDKTYSDSYMDKWYHVFNKTDFLESKPTQTTFPKDATTIEPAKKQLTPTYYSIGLNTSHYKKMWENIGNIQGKTIKDVYGSSVEVSPDRVRGLVDVCNMFNILISKIQNLNKYPDDDLVKLPNKVPKPIDISYFVDTYLPVDKLDFTTLYNKLVERFNSLPKKTGEYFAKQLMQRQVLLADEDDEMKAKRLIHADARELEQHENIVIEEANELMDIDYDLENDDDVGNIDAIDEGD